MESVTSSAGLKTIQLNDQKAGMQGLDKEMINKIIYETSKGTPYFAFQEKRQRSIDFRVKELKSILEKVTDQEKKASRKKMDILCASLEAERDLSHSIVHIDMDAFYAAVEMEDNPTLKGKPVAVGSFSMLSTSNYEARKYGVRAAMPGFIGKKLCPQLTIVPCHFARYREVSNMVRSIVREYDPDYCPASLDEMYLDLTEFIKNEHKKHMHQNACLKPGCAVENDDYKACLGCNSNILKDDRDERAFDIVNEIREKIFQATHLTASAGIAPNVMLAKVGSDQNKPNGQYQIKSTPEDVHSFTSSMPVKKVSGIGPVTGQILNALGIYTCWDMWEKRDIIPILFKDSSADFYMRIALGIASTTVKSDHVRKSIGVEQTFREICQREDLHKKCQELCEEAVEDLKLRNMVGKVVVLKFKTTSFESHTRNHTLSCYSADLEVIHKAAMRLLDTEIAAVSPSPLRLRLMGIRIANLIYEDTIPNNEKHIKLKDFLKAKSLTKQTLENPAEISSICDSQLVSTNFYQVCSSTGKCEENDSVMSQSGPSSNNKFFEKASHSLESQVLYTCPVCLSNQMKSLEELNTHIDNCLNKAAIKEILADDLIRQKRKQPWEEKQNNKRKICHGNAKKIEDYFC